jgi:hypothetical protein
MFLLAGIEIQGLTQIPNQYWPESYVEARQNSPWWVVKTMYGEIVIGWRKKVISIEWSDTGVVFPLDDPENRKYRQDQHVLPPDSSTTKWATGCHAYGYGEAVSTLKALKDSVTRANYLTEHYISNNGGVGEWKEYVMSGDVKPWVETKDPKHVMVIITGRSESHVIQQYHRRYPNHLPPSAHLKSERDAFYAAHPDWDPGVFTE